MIHLRIDSTIKTRLRAQHGGGFLILGLWRCERNDERFTKKATIAFLHAQFCKNECTKVRAAGGGE